jgi:hypothetical protein
MWPHHILFIGKYQYDTVKHKGIIDYCLQQRYLILAGLMEAQFTDEQVHKQKKKT